MRSISSLLLAAALVPFAAPPVHAACPVPMGGWGVSGSGPGEFNLPIALARDASNRWLVCDQHNNRIQIFDSDGAFLGSFGETAGLFHPSGIAVNGGLVYVSDHQNHRVVLFNLGGVVITTFSTGFHPVGVAVDGSGFVYVGVDGAVQKFTGAGSLVTAFGIGVVSRPYGVRVDPGAVIWASDYGNSRLHRFTSAGTHLDTFGYTGNGPGGFLSPENVAFGDDGRIYVADTGNDRVQVFSSSLTYECEFGGTGGGPSSLDVPSDLAFDASGRLVITDYKNDRIRIWGYPPVSTVATTWGALKQIYR